jgi:hypothetical protein
MQMVIPFTPTTTLNQVIGNVCHMGSLMTITAGQWHLPNLTLRPEADFPCTQWAAVTTHWSLTKDPPQKWNVLPTRLNETCQGQLLGRAVWPLTTLPRKSLALPQPVKN